MQAVFLKFYVQENHRHHGTLTYEWLLETAKALGLPGGSAMRAIAGYGRHGRMQQQRFYELAGDLPVEVGFSITSQDSQRLRQRVEAEGLCLFYIEFPVQMGVVGETP
jgi:PII-like signaling protein